MSVGDHAMVGFMNIAPPVVSTTDLTSMALRLLATLDGYIISNQARAQTLDQLVRESQTWQHRRAAHSERDRGCYRAGAALEPHGGHLLDDVTLSGLDHLGAVGVALLVQVAVEHPGLSLSELVGQLFRSTHGELVRRWGEWCRWHWLRELVHEETKAFLTTKAGRDPKARWRSASVTARQSYLILELARVLEIMAPEFQTRGEAFDWIYGQGGNPRFQTPPPTPPLPSFGVARD